MDSRTQVRAIPNHPYEGDGIQLFVMESRDGKGYHAAPCEMVEHQEGGIMQPHLRLDMDKAQVLMNELWDCGIRPAGAKGSAGQLKAVERHLEDMRKLVFKEK